jgi:hypothetical protein
MSAPVRSALLRTLLLGGFVLLPSLSLADDKSADFEVKPDPVEALKGPFDTKASLPHALIGQALFPRTPSPFVALTPADVKDQSQLRVYDLRTMKAVGEPIKAKFDAFTYDKLALSPDGAYLAARPKAAKKATVEVWAVDTGKVSKIEVDDDPKVKVTLVEFAGKDRLLTMKHEHEFPDWEAGAKYQVWDLKKGKAAAEFSDELLFEPRWAALSPGRRYMVMEHTKPGFLISFTDLTTGKKAGEFAFQDKKDAWGQAGGMAFSPDGTELAMLWRHKAKDLWGRLLVWETKGGKKLFDHKITGNEIKMIDSLWFEGGTKSLQWVPDKSGWLLFGHLLIDRESGAVVGTVGNAPAFSGAITECRFLDKDHLAVLETGLQPKVTITTLPRADIDAAVKKAREAMKKP